MRTYRAVPSGLSLPTFRVFAPSWFMLFARLSNQRPTLTANTQRGEAATKSEIRSSKFETTGRAAGDNRTPRSMRTRRAVRVLPSPSPRPLPRGEGEP